MLVYIPIEFFIIASLLSDEWKKNPAIHRRIVAFRWRQIFRWRWWNFSVFSVWPDFQCVFDRSLLFILILNIFSSPRRLLSLSIVNWDFFPIANVYKNMNWKKNVFKLFLIHYFSIWINQKVISGDWEIFLFIYMKMRSSRWVCSDHLR